MLPLSLLLGGLGTWAGLKLSRGPGARYPAAGAAWTPLKLYEMSRPRELTQQGWEQMRERGLKTPLDNPDYEAFADDYRAIAGAYPPLTTALALRDPERTRRMLDRFDADVCRFSILTDPQDPYTQRLLSALPRPGWRPRRRTGAAQQGGA